jgi:hypothetical protein
MSRPIPSTPARRLFYRCAAAALPATIVALLIACDAFGNAHAASLGDAPCAKGPVGGTAAPG